MTDEPLEIHLLADSTGESAARVARAAVAQFPSKDFKLVRHRRLHTEALMTALKRCARGRQADSRVLHPVQRGVGQAGEDACQRWTFRMPTDDRCHARAPAHQRHQPGQVPLRPVRVEADYFVRIAAIDFAVRNDDGAAPASLTECDICLVGPSRSGKTPLSIFLGYLGYKAVNVPLVPGIEPPSQLWDVDKWRIVGLTMDAEKLLQIRSERVRGLGARGMQDGYNNLTQICDELDEVAMIHRKLGCPIINTTDMALEESAARVIDIVEERAHRLGTQLRRLPNVSSELPRR